MRSRLESVALPIAVMILAAASVWLFVLPVAKPTGTHEASASYLLTDEGRPVTWSSCKPLVVFLAGPGPFPEIRRAVRSVSEASGIRMVVTRASSNSANQVPGAIVVRTVSSSEMPVEGARGLTMPKYTTEGFGSRAPQTIASATLLLDAANRLEYDRDVNHLIAVHELGHALGLLHTDGTSVMTTNVSDSLEFTDADRKAFRTLGRTVKEGC